jgi:hypothetical protein
MVTRRRTYARFTTATPVSRDGGVGVILGFRPERTRTVDGPIEDYADLGPALTVPAVAGLGKVLRLLRAARIAAPAEPLHLVGRHEAASDLLARAVGVAVRLEVEARVRQRFVAWTEAGVTTVDDVAEVREYDDAFFVVRRRGRYPVRIERATLLRHRTETERWHEVMEIERA